MSQVNVDLMPGIGTAAVQALIDAAIPYRVYTAQLTQEDDLAPVGTIERNTLTGTPILSRDSAGNYDITLNGAFTPGKTIIFLGSIGACLLGSSITSSDSIRITTFSIVESDFSDNQLQRTSIEIRVYS